ncbi:hypothetical protein LL3_02928 [Bacillus amyloliquefaciens LL3]|nr:hypothetical protein LL3_02928 [Bacillus amyloliquefaciens LL3]
MRSVSIFLLFLKKCKTDGEKGKAGIFTACPFSWAPTQITGSFS